MVAGAVVVAAVVVVVVVVVAVVATMSNCSLIAVMLNSSAEK